MPPPTTPLPEALLKHAGFVRALAFAALRGDAESEDVAQDAWVAALQHAPADSSRQRSWFVRVVKNRAAELFRLRGRRARREQVAAERRPTSVGTDALAEQAETGRRLVGAVLALEEPFRSAILLRFHEDLPPREVAQRLGVPVETAHSRVRRGLERLRILLGQGAGTRGSDWRSALVPLLPGSAVVGTSFGTAGGIVAGGVAMKKFAAVALLLLLVGSGAWILWGSGGRGPVEPSLQTLTADGASQDAGTEATPGQDAPTLEGNAPAPKPESDPSPSTPDRDIRGIVVDEAGQPVPGAVVRVPRPTLGLSLDLRGSRGGSSGSSRFGPATADAEGRFVFPQRDGTFSNGAHLQAMAPGRVQKGPASGTFALAGKETRLVLVAGVIADVEVLAGDTGVPVTGATVQVFEGGGYVLVTSDPIEEALTDATGHARLTVPGGSMSFVARAPGKGFAVARRELLAPPMHALRLKLQAGGTLEGTVLQADGRPAAGLDVLLLCYPSERRWAVSDGEGRIRFEDVPSQNPAALESKGQRIVTLAVEPGERQPRHWFTADLPLPGEVRQVRLQLAELRRLSGTLRRADGAPAAGVAWAYAVEEGRVEWGWTSQSRRTGVDQLTDAEGKFHTPGLPPGRVFLWFGNPLPMEPTMAATVPVGSEPAPIQATLDDVVRFLRVLVLDAEGVPVRGAKAVLLGLTVEGERVSAQTSSDGLAKIQRLGAPPWQILIDHPRFGPMVLAIPEALAADPEAPVTVRLGSGVLEGRVRRLDGSPAEVRLVLALPVGLDPPWNEALGWQGGVTSDAEGRFRFARVSEGKHGVRSASMDFRVVEGAYEHRAGATSIELHLATAAEALALTLAVEVIDAASGRGLVQGVRLEARPDAGGSALPFDPEPTAGMFSAKQLALPGRWTIRASCEGFEAAEATADVTATTAVPRLRLALRRR